MPKFQIKINSILGGQANSLYYGREDQFQGSLNIDPDLSLGGSGDVKTANILVPSTYADFTGANLTAQPKWIITTPKNSNVYAYLSNGRVLSYSSALTALSETLIGTLAGGDGSGAAYYNNYIYFAGATDISRYGPLDGTPALTENVWTGTTLGSQTALTDTTYPSFRGVEIPSHAMHLHVDDKLYFSDFINGQGLIHFIKTKKTTAEGDTNDGSTYNAIDLPFGYMPTDIESYGNDLAIIAIFAGSDATIIQGKASLFLWDTVSDSFYAQIPLPDPVATALLNHNGRLIIFSGNMSNGVRISEYRGGSTVQTLALLEEGNSPFAGAVDSLGSRIVWGGFTTYPDNSASVFAIGFKNREALAVHNIINTDAVANGTDEIVTSLKYVQQADFINPRLVVGWKDSTNQGIDKLTASSANTSNFRSFYYTVGRPFKINRLIIPLAKAVGANMTLIPTLLVDDGKASEAQTTINNTNYTASERRIVQYPTIEGLNNVALQLRWTGTEQLPVALPIIIEGETLNERTE